MKTSRITVHHLSTKDLEVAVVIWLDQRGIRCRRDNVALYRTETGEIRGEVEIHSDDVRAG